MSDRAPLAQVVEFDADVASLVGPPVGDAQPDRRADARGLEGVEEVLLAADLLAVDGDDHIAQARAARARERDSGEPGLVARRPLVDLVDRHALDAVRARDRVRDQGHSRDAGLLDAPVPDEL